jgi:hypothetical protein
MPYGRDVVISRLWFLSPYALLACTKPWRRQAPHDLRLRMTLCSMPACRRHGAMREVGKWLRNN